MCKCIHVYVYVYIHKYPDVYMYTSMHFRWVRVVLGSCVHVLLWMLHTNTASLSDAGTFVVYMALHLAQCNETLIKTNSPLRRGLLLGMFWLEEGKHPIGLGAKPIHLRRGGRKRGGVEANPPRGGVDPLPPPSSMCKEPRQRVEERRQCFAACCRVL